MRNKITSLWLKMSRNGLREDEGIQGHREVIFVNRMMFISPIVMLLYVPVEIIFNGVKMLPPVLIFIGLLFVPVITNHFRLFTFSKYYTVFVTISFLVIAGLTVGPGTYNHVALIAIVLMGVILFKNNYERILIFALIVLAFVIQQYGYTVIPPFFDIPLETRTTFSYIFFIMAMLVNFLLAYYFVGLNKEYEEIIEKQKNSLADKNKEITDSIAYAKRIQKAILPSQKTVQSTIPDSFVLYKPKDIVAGDFYWIEQVDTKIMIAAADCTGHGVPGAMVSVVCHNALNRAVREFGLKSPNLILDKTRELIVQEFEKSDEEIKDGMDISLACLSKNPDSGVLLEWSGANNPLVIITKSGIQEIKADKQPVGKFLYAKNFTNHSLKLEPGTIFYLFTDGFADQFGGPHGKKFKYNLLKKLFETVHDKPMSEQQWILEKNLNDWRGSLEQVDDVCIIGVRV